MPPHSGADARLLENIRRTGRTVITLHAGDDSGVDCSDGRNAIEDIAAALPHVTGPEGRIGQTLVTTRVTAQGTFVHIVHWGQGQPAAQLKLPGIPGRQLRDLTDNTTTQVDNGRAQLVLTPGHQAYVLSD